MGFYIEISGGTGTYLKFENGVIGIRQVKHGFSSFFCQFFGIAAASFDDFSKFYSIFSALHFEKSSNSASIWQKMKKSLVQLALKPWY